MRFRTFYITFRSDPLELIDCVWMLMHRERECERGWRTVRGNNSKILRTYCATLCVVPLLSSSIRIMYVFHCLSEHWNEFCETISLWLIALALASTCESEKVPSKWEEVSLSVERREIEMLDESGALSVSTSWDISALSAKVLHGRFTYRAERETMRQKGTGWKREKIYCFGLFDFESSSFFHWKCWFRTFDKTWLHSCEPSLCCFRILSIHVFSLSSLQDSTSAGIMNDSCVILWRDPRCR